MEYIVCVDDEPIVLQSLKLEFRTDPFFSDVSIVTTGSPQEVPQLILDLLADGGDVPVIVSDQRMPKISGDQMLLDLHNIVSDTKKILLTGFSDLTAVVNLVNHDALYRFISKPWNRQDLLLTIKDALISWRQERRITDLTSQIENMTYAMVAALETANHFFDEDTGNHLRRIAKLSGLIAGKSGLDTELIREVTTYAPLHDIGKVGIPREILFKPERLTPDEFSKVKEHVRIGHAIIDNDAISTVAKNIVLYHHEKWNGTGYPDGLHGEAIPLEARVVSIADVFDALVNERIYKKAFSLEETKKILSDERGISFDPALLDPFIEELKKISTLEELFEN